MSILDKAKDISGKMAEKAGDLGGEELIANTIIRAVNKQEKVNKLLEEKGCSYRISGVDMEMGIPPKIVFGVSRLGD